MGYIQTKLMTCCLGRKHINLVLFCKIFNSYVYVSVDNYTINNSGRYFNCRVCNLENIVTKLWKGNFRSWDFSYFTIFDQIWGIDILSFLQNFHCVTISRNIDIGIEYFLNFCQDNKSWVPFQYNPCNSLCQETKYRFYFTFYIFTWKSHL